MAEFTLRRLVVVQEEIFHDGGPRLDVPRRRAAALALVTNPFAGRFAGELQPAMDDLKPLGLTMTDRLVEVLGGDASAIDGYGKGAIVGTAGEIEHGAMWHVPGGYAMRERLGEAKAIVPSAMKVGGFGARLDVPLGHINAAYVRSHFDAIEARVGDAPRPNEIVVAVSVTDSGRPLPRVGGLTTAEVKGEDGLR